MLYNPPTGGAANDPYVGKIIAAGQQGSKVPPKAVENPQREIVNAITATGGAPTNTDLTQLLQALMTGVFVGKFGGTPDAMTATLPGGVTIPTPLAGMRISGIVPGAAGVANTGTGPTFACSSFLVGSAATAVRRRGGGAPAAGDLVAGDLVTFRLDADGRWRIAGVVASDVAGWNGSGGSSGSAISGRLAHGQCTLTAPTASTLLLTGKNGCNVLVNGVQVQIAVAGVTANVASAFIANATSTAALQAGVSIAALTAVSTIGVYLVSLNVASGTQLLRFWPIANYGHVTDTTVGNVGVEVISNGGAPVSTDTLVGMVSIAPDGTIRAVASWFNRQRKVPRGVPTASRSVGSSTFTEFGTDLRVPFLAWAGASVPYMLVGNCECGYYTNGEGSANVGVAFDSNLAAAIEPDIASFGQSGTGGTYYYNNVSLRSYKTGLSEGLHFATVLGSVNAGAYSNIVVAPTSLTTPNGGFALDIEAEG